MGTWGKIRQVLPDWSDVGRFMLVLSILLIIGLILWGSYLEFQQWEKFKTDHACVVTGRIAPSSSVGVGVGTNGSPAVVLISEPGKTGWLCDDGVTYWY